MFKEVAIPTPMRLTGGEIEQKIIAEIESGRLTRGMQLPSVREMAEEMGVNKNTIVRVYRALHQQGYLKVVQGSGTYVREDGRATVVPVNAATDDVTDSPWHNRVVAALQTARRHGVDQEAATRALFAAVHQVYEQVTRRLLFIECNQYDIDSLSNVLSHAIGQRLQGVMINDFLENSESYVANHDLVITTFFHLNEIEPIVNALDPAKFVAVHAMPTQDALLEIARLQVPVLGVVADQPRALDNVIHIVKTYQQSATIMSSSLEDSVRLQNLLDKADAIAVTQSRYPGLMKHNPQIPVVPLSLTISQESIEHLQQHLALLPQAV